VQDLFAHEDNPVRRVMVAREIIRRRVDVADDALDFPILHDLKAQGATDYFALPVKSSLGTNYMVTYVTDRVDGFTEKEISDLIRVSQRLSLLADLRNQRRIASNILTAYGKDRWRLRSTVSTHTTLGGFTEKLLELSRV
jgi:adenylate cyclase